jgi:hypothetical protein
MVYISKRKDVFSLIKTLWQDFGKS